jgi:hypothetical protein
MNLYLEFDNIVRHLRRGRISFAVAGGLAVGLHGFVRATQDMDFLVEPADLARTSQILQRLGYRANADSQTLAHDGLTIQRFWKRSTGAADLLIVDLLVPGSASLRRALRNAVTVKYGRGRLPVVTARDLVAMKRRRDSPTDRADIAFLRRRA